MVRQIHQKIAKQEFVFAKKSLDIQMNVSTSDTRMGLKADLAGSIKHEGLKNIGITHQFLRSRRYTFDF